MEKRNALRQVVVYCGANLGQDKAFFDAAQAMGQALAAGGHTLVYGGGNIGLMGTLADAALAHGARVIGVIPTFLKQKEVAHQGLSELIETQDMSSRKAAMIARAEGFIAMPGGLGTYEELFEVLSQAQLKLHPYPVGVLNINGFFDPLLGLLRQTAHQGFMPHAHEQLLCVAHTPQALLAQMAAWQAPEANKWVAPAWKHTS